MHFVEACIINNGMVYFGKSTDSVRKSVVLRFNNEKLDALESLKQELAGAPTPTQSGQQGEVVLPTPSASA